MMCVGRLALQATVAAHDKQQNQDSCHRSLASVKRLGLPITCHSPRLVPPKSRFPRTDVGEVGLSTPKVQYTLSSTHIQSCTAHPCATTRTYDFPWLNLDVQCRATRSGRVTCFTSKRAEPASGPAENTPKMSKIAM
jgi:hypothetical protein